MIKHYRGEVGTEILVDCGMDISAAINTYIYCRKPDGSKVSWPATITNSNYLSYITQTDDLSLTGAYRVQAGLTLGGWTGRGETASFIIYPQYA